MRAFCSTSSTVIPLPVNLLNDPEDLLHQKRRKTHGRFVHQDHLRLCHERPTNGQHLLLAAGECACQLPPPLRKARKALVNRRERIGHAGLVCVGAHFQILGHAHLRENMPAFRHVRQLQGDNFAGRGVKQVVTVKNDASGGRLLKPRDGAERRRLARAVRTDQRDNLAVSNLQGNAAQRLHRAVIYTQILHLKHALPPPAPCDPCRDTPQ